MHETHRFNARALACEILHDVIVEQRSLSNVLPRRLTQAPVKEKALVQELCYGSARWYFYLEARCIALMQRPMDKRDAKAKILLVIGAYQVLMMRTPNHAAINETVDASETLQLHRFKALINAILRKLAGAEAIDQADALATQSFPEWMQAKLTNNWPEQAANIFTESNARPPMCLRVNAKQYERHDYLSKLKNASINAVEAPFSSYGVYLESPCDVDALPDFSSGAVSVQDEAAQLCTQLLDLAPEQSVLDACAAPGGKTCAMLEQAPGINVTAIDCEAIRLKRLDDNLNRLSLSAQVICAQVQDLKKWWDGEGFDRILIDAPCSASGVIRRHPDIKLLRKQEDLKNLAELQLQLLESLWRTLKNGGRLVYATCSIFPQENSRVIERFLSRTAGAELVSIQASWGFDTGFGRQLFPKENGHDGFFYASLHKL